MDSKSELLRVLHLSGDSIRGGAGTFLRLLVRFNDRQKVKTCVARIGLDQEEREWEHQFPVDDSLLYRIPARYNWDLQLPHHVLQVVEKVQPDVVHTHGYKSDCIGAWLKRSLKCPLVATVHGWTEAVFRDRLYKRLDLLALRQFDKVIGITDYVRMVIIASGVPGDRVTRVYYGIRVPQECQDYNGNSWRKEFGITSDQLVVGSVGRLSPEKGHRFLLQAFAMLRKMDINAHLILVGDGRERASLERDARRLGITSNVSFVGHQSNPIDLMRIFDIFVLPSLREALGWVILEAWSVKVPVVASRVGGVSEIISDRQHGLLTRAGDAEDILAKMVILAKDATLRKDLGQNGFERVVNAFRVERMVAETIKVYEQAIGVETL